MKQIMLKTGEMAYVPTTLEKQIIEVALKQFQNSLPCNRESVMHE